MSDWLAELEEALDRSPAPVPFFFRDDGGGWADERLFQLLDLFGAHLAPVDLAVIPAALGDETADALRGCLDASAGRVRAHQQGFAHRDHQREGERSEFGSDRGLAEQRADLARGAELLARRLSPHVDSIFTPPWNRCQPETGSLALALGFRVLSRDRAAKPLAVPGIVELPVTVEWLDRSRNGGDLARSARDDFAVGVRLQHARMDGAELGALDALLGLLVTHPRAHCTSMRKLARLGRS
jgi:hypothetical protein